MPRQGQGVWINNPEELPGGSSGAGSATAENQEAEINRLEAIRDRLPAAPGQADRADSQPVTLSTEDIALIVSLSQRVKGEPLQSFGEVTVAAAAYAAGAVVGGGFTECTPRPESAPVGYKHILQQIDYISPLAGLTLTAIFWRAVPEDVIGAGGAYNLSDADRDLAVLEVPLTQVSSRPNGAGGFNVRYSAQLGGFCYRIDDSGGEATIDPYPRVTLVNDDDAATPPFASTNGGIIIVSSLVED